MQYVIYCNKLTEAFIDANLNPGESRGRCIARMLREGAEEFFSQAADEDEES